MGNTNSTTRTTREETESREVNNEPWRNFEENGSWTSNYKEKLISDIEGIEIIDDSIKSLNILLCGPIDSGKSAFLNSVAGIDIDRPAQVTETGGFGRSRTTKLKKYIPKKKLKMFNIFDTMGIEGNGSCGVDIADLVSVVKGNIRPGYKFNPVHPIEDTDELFNAGPTYKDKMHCVVFVLDANCLEHERRFGSEKLGDLCRKLESEDIPKIILLTKIDLFCKRVNKDATTTFKSRLVKSVVDEAKRMFKVTERNVFPVQNYSDEVEIDYKKDILILLALRQMVFFATDYLNAKDPLVYQREFGAVPGRMATQT